MRDLPFQRGLGAIWRKFCGATQVPRGELQTISPTVAPEAMARNLHHPLPCKPPRA